MDQSARVHLSECQRRERRRAGVGHRDDEPEPPEVLWLGPRSCEAGRRNQLHRRTREERLAHHAELADETCRWPNDQVVAGMAIKTVSAAGFAAIALMVSMATGQIVPGGAPAYQQAGKLPARITSFT